MPVFVYQVVVCGGSPCVTPLRLALQLALGLSQAVLVCCLPPDSRLLAATLGGYLLSTDTGQSQSYSPVSLSHARVSLSRTLVSLGHYRVAITADRWTTAFLPPWEDTWSLLVSITPMITISYHHANSDRGCRRRNGQGCLVKELDGVGWGWGNILCRLK